MANYRGRIAPLLGPLVAALLLASCTIPSKAGDRFDIALLGDLPYGFAPKRFEQLVDDINQSKPTLVLHVGDIKSGQTTCSDEALRNAHALVTRFEAPLLYTPGDNEWTDCHRTLAGSFHPLDRLRLIRELFFSDAPPFSGREQSAEFPENRLLHLNGITVGSVHVVGSANGFIPWTGFDPSDSYKTPRADRIAEWQQREAAGLRWLQDIFDSARKQQSTGLIIMIHANPQFHAVAKEQRSGKVFEAFVKSLNRHAEVFKKPVLLVHGDYHKYILDKPLGSNLTRVQTDGGIRLSWVNISVNPKTEEVFTVQKRGVPLSRPR